VRLVRTGPAVGLSAHVGALAALSVTVGLGWAGWAAGLGYAVVTAVVLTCGLIRTGGRDFGPADWVTQVRAVLVGLVTALTAAAFERPPAVVLLVSITIVALLLDALDGHVARRTGTASGFGARFDMEADAFLLLVLSVYAAQSMGAWVLAIGGMRYVFVAAGWLLPWMRRRLPPRFWRKVVAATQGVVLVVAASGLIPTALMALVLAGALALLVESFGRDVLWLWQHPARQSTAVA